jgi:hypothetical protein
MEDSMARRISRNWRAQDDDLRAAANASQAGATASASISDIEPSPNPTLPEFDADNFRAKERIDNPYFPLIRGTVYTYGNAPEEEGDDVERNDVFATFENKKILGINTHVVRDTAYENGLVVEDTLDYYAQDKDGNVWYFGELTYAFEYDDDGNFIEATTEGSWLADGVTAFPGYIMPTVENLKALEDGYFQEFSPGVAEDQAELLSFKARADLDIGLFKDVLKTLDTTQLEPDVREIKKYEPGVGFVSAEELTEDGEKELVEQLLGVRLLREGHVNLDLFKDKGDPDLKDLIDDDIGVGDFEQPELKEFRKAGDEVHVTYLGGDTESNNALGIYTFDRKTGLIDDVEILFPEADELEAGEEFVIDLGKDEGYGLFLVPNGAEIGLDLSEFEDGGLEMKNFLTGKQASIYDRMAPQLVDDEGNVLPITAFHALDVNLHDDWNLLNPAGGIQAVELDPATLEDGPWDDKAEVLGFEDMFASDPLFDGDFDDLAVAVSRTTLPGSLVADLIDDLDLAAAGA